MMASLPVQSPAYTWLKKLNILEHEIRIGSKLPSFNLIHEYEEAVNTLPELWQDMTYTIIFLRYAILKGTECLEDCTPLFISISLCASSNTRLMIALAYYYTALGDTLRADNVMNRAKINAKSDLDKHVLQEAKQLYEKKIPLRTFLGDYDYVPFNRGLWGSKIGNELAPVGFLFPKHGNQLRKRTSLSLNLSQPPLERSSSPLNSDGKHVVFIECSPQTTAITTCNAKNLSQISEVNEPTLLMTSKSNCQLYPNINTSQHSKVLADKENSNDLSPGSMRPSLSTTIMDTNGVSVQGEQFKQCRGEFSTMQLTLSSSLSSNNKDVTLVAAYAPQIITSNYGNNLSQINEADESTFVITTKPCCQLYTTGTPAVDTSQYNKVDKENIPINKDSSPKPMPSPLSTTTKDTNRVSVQGEQFKMLRELGRGGFSTVWSVINDAHEVYALKKVSLASSSREVLAICENEVNLLMSLRNSGRVISLHSHELTTDSLTLVMEFAEQDLKSIIHERRTMSSSKSLSYSFILFFWTEMLACVKVLHDKRIMHLDLKPENFVQVKGCLKLIDLGISQRLPIDATHADLTFNMGSVIYISPEQVLCIAGTNFESPSKPKVRLKADIWALGIILYEMMHGKSPFGRTNQVVIMGSIANPACKINFPPTAYNHLDKALRSCLIRNTQQRASIDDLINLDYY